MNTLALTASRLSIGEAGIAAVLGYAVVFTGLVLLMCVVIIMGKAMASSREKAKTAAAAPAPVPAAPAAPAAAEVPVVPEPFVPTKLADPIDSPYEEPYAEPEAPDGDASQRSGGPSYPQY